MIIKAIGAILMITASTALGIEKAQELSRRVKVLCSIQDGIISF